MLAALEAGKYFSKNNNSNSNSNSNSNTNNNNNINNFFFNKREKVK